VKAGDWTDIDSIRAACWLSDKHGIDLSSSAIFEAIQAAAAKNRVHPVRDWLEGLRWDAKPRAATWLVDVFGCDNTPYVRAVGTAWLIACVARILRPGCKVDTVPILEGEQGIGKSSALRALVGDDWFLELSISDVSSTDAMQVLRRKWVAEMPELDGWSRAETSHLKGYVSRQTDTYRPSYGRGARDFPRQCTFIGTTNAKEYLKDETGNRRFWPVACRRGDVELVRAIREQLWAEAVARFQGREPWHITDPALLAVFTEEQDARYRSDPWEQLVSAWLEKPADPPWPHRKIHGVTTADVLRGALGIDSGKITQVDSNRMGAVLRRLGGVCGKQERRSGARVRPFRWPSAVNGIAPDVLPVPAPEDSQQALLADL
jgi:putative DNA primase/helicase